MAAATTTPPANLSRHLSAGLSPLRSPFSLFLLDKQSNGHGGQLPQLLSTTDQWSKCPLSSLSNQCFVLGLGRRLPLFSADLAVLCGGVGRSVKTSRSPFSRFSGSALSKKTAAVAELFGGKVFSVTLPRSASKPGDLLSFRHEHR
nr:hypothetical protein Itr_chr09CG13660 [Ipomoea trifida]